MYYYFLAVLQTTILSQRRFVHHGQAQISLCLLGLGTYFLICILSFSAVVASTFQAFHLIDATLQSPFCLSSNGLFIASLCWVSSFHRRVNRFKNCCGFLLDVLIWPHGCWICAGFILHVTEGGTQSCHASFPGVSFVCVPLIMHDLQLLFQFISLSLFH